MHLYSVALSETTAIVHSILGSFTEANADELVFTKGKIIELCQIDAITGKVKLVMRQEVFGLIRSVSAFRLMGMQTDFVVVGSDSGRIVILEYDPAENRFVKVHQETYGKTGCRRIVPGEYLAVDPKGRAIMIGAVEKQKFVYILNRDTNNKLTISSPLEAFKAHVLTLDMVGVDVGIEHPQFACLEIDYGDTDQNFSAVNTGKHQKTLTIYEMDLGLNHVIRKHLTPVDQTAHRLVAVPADSNGPGGIIVVCENFLIYTRPDHEDRKCYIPVRHESQIADQTRGLFIAAHATFDTNGLFFIFASELGDLYKVTLDYTQSDVHSISVQYFDTIAPSLAINILKSGYLFSASESGNHLSLLFKSDGSDDTDAAICSSHNTGSIEQNYAKNAIKFNPRGMGLKNLEIRDEMRNLAPINDMKIEDFTNEGAPQIYLACGRGAQGTLRTLRHGLSVAEMAVSQMPARPLTVTTLRNKLEDPNHSFMIVGFEKSTLVLRISDDKVSQVTNSGFAANETTLHAGLLEGDIFIQVTSRSLIQIQGRGDQKKRTKWESDKGRILMACSNTRQVVILIEGGQLVYFELDPVTGLLNENQTQFFQVEIKCIDIGSVPEGRQRTKFLVAAFEDQTTRILSLEPDYCLQRISMVALTSIAESVSFMQVGVPGSPEEQTFLLVGLENGVLQRLLVDRVTGLLTDSRQQFLGTRGVRLSKIRQQGEDAIVAVSNRPWLCYRYMGQQRVTPLSYDNLTMASCFSSERCSEGIVAIAEDSLRIVQVENIGEQFTEQVLQTRHTPCRLVNHPESNNLVILERDHMAYNEQELGEIRLKVFEETKDDAYFAQNDYSKMGSYPRAPKDKFSSCLRLVDPTTLQTLSVTQFEPDETCFSVYCSQGALGNQGSIGSETNESYLFCGIGLNSKLTPRSCSLGFIKTYRFLEKGSQLELLHSTPCEDIPGAFGEVQGRLVAGVGNILRIYELGIRKLLRKQENKNFASPIIQIKVGDPQTGRIFAADMNECIHALKCSYEESQLYIYADEVLKRWTTSFCLLDPDTVCGVDKFENLYINRLPAGCEHEAEDDPTATKFKWENGFLNGAAFKMETLCQYFLGETATQVQKACLTPSHLTQDYIIAATSMGSLQAFVPFETREDVEFFMHLEMYLRIEAPPLAGRDHVTFRSMYAPVKDVVDGDLCMQFSSLDVNKQRVMAEELDRTPQEVYKKIEQMQKKLF